MKYFNIKYHYFRKLAEPLDGAPNNYWIVDQLQTRLYEKHSPEEFEGLEGPRYDDIWWMGGKSYVSKSCIKTITLKESP